MYKNSASVGRIACRLLLYRVVQLNFTPEIEVLHMSIWNTSISGVKSRWTTLYQVSAAAVRHKGGAVVKCQIANVSVRSSSRPNSGKKGEGRGWGEEPISPFLEYFRG